ncbi:hypothetical protein Tco_0806402 [Tanacetum coccineum]
MQRVPLKIPYDSLYVTLTDSLCFGGGGTDGGSDGESGLDLLRDKDGNSGESSGWTRLVDRDRPYKAGVRSGDGGAGLIGKVVISLSKSDMMTKGVNTLARGEVAGKVVGQGVVMVL